MSSASSQSSSLSSAISQFSLLSSGAEKAVQYAKEQRTQDLSRLLAERRNLINEARTRRGSSSLLHIACRTGNVEMASMLLMRGAEINAVNDQGSTPLMIALAFKHEATALLMLQQGADVGVRNQWNRTALHIACRTGCAVAVLQLMLRGALVNTVDTEGNTPLLSAIENDHLDVAIKLIENRAAFTHRNKWGQSALHLARAHGMDMLVDLMVELKQMSAQDAAMVTGQMRMLEGGQLELGLSASGSVSTAALTRRNGTQHAVTAAHNDLVGALSEEASSNTVHASNRSTSGVAPLTKRGLKQLQQSASDAQHQHQRGISIYEADESESLVSSNYQSVVSAGGTRRKKRVNFDQQEQLPRQQQLMQSGYSSERSALPINERLGTVYETSDSISNIDEYESKDSADLGGETSTASGTQTPTALTNQRPQSQQQQALVATQKKRVFRIKTVIRLFPGFSNFAKNPPPKSPPPRRPANNVAVTREDVNNVATTDLTLRDVLRRELGNQIAASESDDRGAHNVTSRSSGLKQQLSSLAVAGLREGATAALGRGVGSSALVLHGATKKRNISSRRSDTGSHCPSQRSGASSKASSKASSRASSKRSGRSYCSMSSRQLQDLIYDSESDLEILAMINDKQQREAMLVMRNTSLYGVCHIS